MIHPSFIPDNPPGYIHANNDSQAKSDFEAVHNVSEWLSVPLDDCIALKFKGMWACFIVDSEENRIKMKRIINELNLNMILLNKLMRDNF